MGKIIEELIVKYFREVVQDSYNGNLHATIKSLLKLHEKYG